MEQQAMQLFESTQVRMVWNEEEEKWYFSIADIVQILTDSEDVKQYIKRMRTRDPELNGKWGTICTPVRMRTMDGKYRQVQAADMEGILRVIQSIPSKKAEPIKQWLAEVGSKRIDQMIDPELTFQMAVEDYRRQGYTDEWINERMKSIMTRKALTDEWKRVGITKEQDYAILTNILTKAWSGMTTREYKTFKGLTKQNLRDNMTGVEVALNTLAEASTRELSRQRNPKTLQQSKHIAQDGGGVAKVARQQLEKELGKPVISPYNTEQMKRIEDTHIDDTEILPDKSTDNDPIA